MKKLSKYVGRLYQFNRDVTRKLNVGATCDYHYNLLDAKKEQLVCKC